ncbi:MAG: hypothetical protein GY801_28900 [bacterium]|nr:hypothetical protein [bacterium]
MNSTIRFSYTPVSEFGSNVPYIPLTLQYQGRSLDVEGLVDTGASVNVLPYEFGMQLGAIWEQQPKQLTLTGNLANYEARGLAVYGTVGAFRPVELVFAWTRMRDVPVILGQMNFFLAFNVCIFGTQGVVEMAPSV